MDGRDGDFACGNCFINKPSERDPSAPLFLAELWKEAGLPDGVWNVVNGDKEAVDALLQHPDVPAISFVGSTPVGEYIYQTGTAHNKRVQAFCGAKNHMIIMPDANMDQAADALMGAGLRLGRRALHGDLGCGAGGRRGRRGDPVPRLEPRVRALKIGPYNDPEADMGPLVTAQAKAKVEGLIDAGVAEGADLVVDGRGATLQGYENGYFVGGTLFDHVTTDMEIYRTEIFGPVLSMARATASTRRWAW